MTNAPDTRRSRVSGITGFRSSCLQIFFKIGVLKNFADFSGNTVLKALFNKVEKTDSKTDVFL